MKILLDTCVWGGARKDLEAVGHDVVGQGIGQKTLVMRESLHMPTEKAASL
jgi:hypothetical protein